METSDKSCEEKGKQEVQLRQGKAKYRLLELT